MDDVDFVFSIQDFTKQDLWSSVKGRVDTSRRGTGTTVTERPSVQSEDSEGLEIRIGLTH